MLQLLAIFIWLTFSYYHNLMTSEKRKFHTLTLLCVLLSRTVITLKSVYQAQNYSLGQNVQEKTRKHAIGTDLMKLFKNSVQTWPIFRTAVYVLSNEICGQAILEKNSAIASVFNRKLVSCTASCKKSIFFQLFKIKPKIYYQTLPANLITGRT